MKQFNDLEVSNQDFVSKLAFMDDLVRSREQEKEMLMNAYRNLCSENQSVKEQISLVVQENQQLLEKQSEFTGTLEEASLELEKKSEELEQCKTALASAEQQCEYLTNSLASAQGQLSQMEGRNAEAMQDLESVRHLAFTVDEGREDAKKQVTLLSMEKERLEKTIQQLSVERDSIFEQLKNETGARDRLEKLLISERGKVMKESIDREAHARTSEMLQQKLKNVEGTQHKSIQELLDEKKILLSENEKLRGHVLKLESLIREQQELLAQKSLKQISDPPLEKATTTVPATERSSSSNSDASQNGSIEKKILTELELTKHQLNRYEEMIRAKQKEKKKRDLDVSGITFAKGNLFDSANQPTNQHQHFLFLVRFTV